MPEAIEKYSNLKTAGKVLLLLAALLAVELGIGFILLFILMAYLAIAVAGGDLSRLMGLTTASLNTLWFNVPATVLQELTMVGIAALFMWLVERKASPLKALGLRPLKGSLKPFAIGMALGALLIPGTAALTVAAGFTSYDGTGIALYGFPATAFSFAALLTMTFFIAIGEEVFFRGCLQKLLVDKYGVAAGLLVTSAVFMPFHFMNSASPLYLLTIFAASLALGLLFVVARSLYASIGLHFVWNFLLLGVLPVGPSELDIEAYPVFVFSAPKEIILGSLDLGRGYQAIAIVLLFLLVAALYIYRKQRQQ